MKTCFSIMPFDDQFNDISDIISKAASVSGLEYVRSDFDRRSGNIMAQVKHEIQRAAVVVADITSHNANVFYELGIAHHIVGPERVVIITQSVDRGKAFDIHQYRQLVYTHSKPGRKKLIGELPGRLREAAEASVNREFWNVTRGRLPRTLMLVENLQRIIDRAGTKGLQGTIIRVVANLSSLAISEHEPKDSALGDEYHNALLAERDTLRNALIRGARLKAVLNPPRHFTKAQMPDRLSARYRRLIGLLEGRSDIKRNPNAAAEDLKAIKQCEFVVCPVPMPNLMIIGDEVAYEGMKRSNAGGFEMTHCETEAHELRELAKQFDKFFDESKIEMARSHPPHGGLLEQLRAFHREADPKGRSVRQ